jgi:hypothetical protein
MKTLGELPEGMVKLMGVAGNEIVLGTVILFPRAADSELAIEDTLLGCTRTNCDEHSGDKTAPKDGRIAAGNPIGTCSIIYTL